MNPDIHAIVAMSPVIPVIVLDDSVDALALGQALLDGGITIAEVTLRTPAGIEAIRVLGQELPQLCTGAGTVLDAADARRAVDAGASFLVSPGATESLVHAAQDLAVPLLPGVSSAGECLHMRDLGLTHLKFFPAESSGGVAWLKAVGSALGDIVFCPTGGVGPGNVQEYLALDNVACVGGSWLTPGAALAAGNYAAVTDACRDTLTLLDS